MTVPLDTRIAMIKSRHPFTVHAALGVEITSYDPVTIEVDVTDKLKQELGIVHGGVYVLLAESAASLAAALRVDIMRFNVSGQAIEAHHLRPMREGRIVATPTLVHEGRTSLVYDITVREQDGRAVSLNRCTIAVRPWPDGVPVIP